MFVIKLWRELKFSIYYFSFQFESTAVLIYIPINYDIKFADINIEEKQTRLKV